MLPHLPQKIMLNSKVIKIDPKIIISFINLNPGYTLYLSVGYSFLFLVGSKLSVVENKTGFHCYSRGSIPEKFWSSNTKPPFWSLFMHNSFFNSFFLGISCIYPFYGPGIVKTARIKTSNNENRLYFLLIIFNELSFIGILL